MALTFTRTLINPINGVTIANGASSQSVQQTVGLDAELGRIRFYLKVDFTDAGGVPDGNMVMSIIAIHTAAGDEFDDQAISYPFYVDAKQMWYFSCPLCELPVYFDLKITNSTGQATDNNETWAWIEYTQVDD